MSPCRLVLFAFSVLGIGFSQAAGDKPKVDKPNVLLILVDDLKPALGCYGDPVAKTPNIDALAKRGMRFDLAYCNQAVCAPSRFTLMLGSHSTSTGLYGLGSQLREVLPDAVTLPQYFAKQGGYRTESLGKVFHIGHGNEGDPASFAVPHFADKVIEYLDPASTGGGKLTREEALFTNRELGRIKSLPRGMAFESPVAEDADYADGRVAAEAVVRLRAAKRRRTEDGTPFFIAVGFVRPHLPFSVPKKYWDGYDSAKLPMPDYEEAPVAAPKVAVKRGGEITAYEPVPVKGGIDAGLTRKLIHGYYASTSFVDAQIGKVMAECDRLDLEDDTIVVLWGDHGFHLGDHGIWTKHTNYEQANRIPLLICAPGVGQANSSTRQLAESVDIFPTLAELAGLPTPSGPQPVDGVSLVPVLRDPKVRVRDHAFHAFPRKKLGRSIRTERYRLVEWKQPGEDPAKAEYELYDYETDPLEKNNLAAQRPGIAADLKRRLDQYPEPVDPKAGRKVSRNKGNRATEAGSAGGGETLRAVQKKRPPANHPAEKPHIILVMVDDMGFSDLGYHGGEIDTPNIDALARGGVRFSQFYNSGRCCPTRATLMTGLHPHQTGIGWMTQPPDSERGATQPPAYQGYLNRQCVTIAEALGKSGYATLMTGKWHLGYNARDRWPLQRGFEKYYGCVPGALRLFHPQHPRGILLGNEKIENPASTTDEAFYTTDAFTDYAIRFLREENEGGKQPTFLYLAYNAPHWPLQAFEDDITKYRGKYRMGWDKLREQRLRRQVELGLVDPKWKLSPRTPGIPAWQTLDEKKRDEMDLKMAVYAAMVDRIDQNIGRLVAFLKESGMYEDSLILFLSDNGACQEGGMFGRGEFYDVEKRNQEEANSYGEAWANAGNTPFRLYKHFAHEGGTATPFFMHWPARIEPRGEWYGDPAQLIDIMPTLLDVAGADYPEVFHGKTIPPLDGVSLRPAFDGRPLARGEPIFIEHESNAFVRDGDWKLVGRGVAPPGGERPEKWELYNMAEDRTETRDLAASHRGKAEELAGKWRLWAKRVAVYPKGKPKKKGGKK